MKDAMAALNEEMMQLGQSICRQDGGAAAACGGGTGDVPKASGSGDNGEAIDADFSESN